MSAIRTNAAAAMLGVSPSTLRSWERRFGYPMPKRTEGGHRQFELTEIEALRQSFAETHDISSAISIARERGEGPSSPARLRAAFDGFREDQADRLLEESLAVRSVERTVESVLLPAVELLLAEGRASDALTPVTDDTSAIPDAQAPPTGGGSPEYRFAWRYSTGWLAAAQRVAPPATREEGVLIFDLSRPADIDALYVQALELLLRRTGLRVLSLPVDLGDARVGSALRALRPNAVVLGGRGAALDALGKLVYAARQAEPGVEVLDYRGALPDTGASTTRRLGESPTAAAEALRERLTGVVPLRPAAASPA
ncbi:MAG TPA: MerR family transcriptional regulator [Solirubrobacteraceae bacterium]|nr:MerR family transcriptional regulator [Solirubrobacteraceae bacterium]